MNGWRSIIYLVSRQMARLGLSYLGLVRNMLRVFVTSKVADANQDKVQLRLRLRRTAETRRLAFRDDLATRER